jgi:hypothetical protein
MIKNATPHRIGSGIPFGFAEVGYALCVSREEPSALVRLRRVRFPRSEDMKIFQQALHSQGKSPSLNRTTFCMKPFRSVRAVRSEPQYLQCGDDLEAVMGRVVFHPY